MKQGQLPLFAVPLSEAEITPQTEFANTWALFQKRLAKEGKTEHTVNAFTSDLHLLAEYAGNHVPMLEIMCRSAGSRLQYLRIFWIGWNMDAGCHAAGSLMRGG